MVKTCFLSIDVEHDRGGGERKFSGVENLDKILSILKKYSIPATLFVTGGVLERYGSLAKEWGEDFEIACHSFSHQFWNTLGQPAREKEITDYLDLYQNVFNGKPQGFRAPSHLIDQAGINLLQERGFLYDSSVVPHYPPFKKYRGFKGRAPLLPYWPSAQNYRQKGEMSLLEIPLRGQVFGFPLAGAWIGRLPFLLYKTLFEVYCPKFLTVSMHSWDILEQPKAKTSPELFLENLEKIIIMLKSKGYQFLNGQQIFQNR
jgi:peptidoglycan/xylan/chitin deacetylase (PgdA/CDA1 family)